MTNGQKFAASMIAALAAALHGNAIPPASEARLVSDSAAIAGGRPFSLGVLITLEEGWHTYWRNPGSSGMAPELAWTLPPGFEAGPVEWPAPSILGPPDMPDYGFERKILLMRTITPPSTLQDREIHFSVTVAWLICRDSCVPKQAELSLTLPVALTPSPEPSPWKREFDDTRSRLPRRDMAWSFNASVRGKMLNLVATPPPGASLERDVPASFIPLESGLLDPGHPATRQRAGNSHTLSMRLVAPASPLPKRLSGILLLPEKGISGKGRALVVDTPLTLENETKQGERK